MEEQDFFYSNEPFLLLPKPKPDTLTLFSRPNNHSTAHELRVKNNQKRLPKIVLLKDQIHLLTTKWNLFILSCNVFSLMDKRENFGGKGFVFSRSRILLKMIIIFL